MRKLAAGLLGYLATAAVWLWIAPYGFNPWDECVLAYGSLRVLGGQVPGLDFYGYAPGRYWFGAAVSWLCGPSLGALRVGFALLTAPMPLLAYSIARRMLPAAWAALPALLVALAPSTYYFRSYPYCALLGAWSLCRVIEAPSRGRLAAHGLVLTLCSAWELASGGFLLLATAVGLNLTAGPWLRGRRLRAGAWSLGAAFAAALPMAWPYLRSGRLAETVGLLARNYAAGGGTLWVPYPRPWQKLWEGDWEAAIQAGFFWALALAVLVAPLYALRAKRQNPTEVQETESPGGVKGQSPFLPGAKDAVEGGLRPHPAKGWRPLPRMAQRSYSPVLGASRGYFASFGVSHAAESQYWMLCLLAALHYLLPVYRAGLFNVVRASPLPWILLVFLAYALFRWRRPAGALALGYPLVFAAHLLLSPLYRGPATGGPPGAAFKHGLLFLDEPRARVYVEPRHAELIRAVCGWADHASAPGDGLFTAPLQPMFYFLCSRDNPTGQDFLMPGGPASLASLQAELAARPPKLIVLCDLPIDGRAERQFKSYARPLHDWILGRYAWTDRFVYGIPQGGATAFDAFRPLLGSPVLEPVLSTQVHGPAELRPDLWRLPAGSRVTLEPPPGVDQVFVFRLHAPPPAWLNPPLLLTRASSELSLTADSLPSADALAAFELRGPLTLSVPASRPEYLGRAWELESPGLSSESRLFPPRSSADH